MKRWEELGVDDLVGFDLSSSQIDQLRTRFPDYRFVRGDSTTAPRDLLLERRFDILTLLDVLYHIVDDDKACRTLTTVASVMDDQSVLLICDQILDTVVSLRAQVKFRGPSVSSVKRAWAFVARFHCSSGWRRRSSIDGA